MDIKPPPLARKPLSLVKEFKEFAVRGNVVDLAVGVIIGGAFGKIVSSLVADVIMPPIGVLLGGMDFSNLAYQISTDKTGAPVLLKYGEFLNNVINFVIVAFAIFIMVKIINTIRRREEASPSVPPAPTREETLLAEIRDILQQSAPRGR